MFERTLFEDSKKSKDNKAQKRIKKRIVVEGEVNFLLINDIIVGIEL